MLIYGAEKSSNKASNLDQLEGFATRVDILPFGDNEAKQFGQVRAELEVKGKLIGPYDMMIAGHARSQGLMLITNNIRQYRKVVARYMLKFKY
ncbi:MAG: tRNA(fMet)-specific endonuclease VapC [Candidatus Endobugula sp.]